MKKPNASDYEITESDVKKLNKIHDIFERVYAYIPPILVIFILSFLYKPSFGQLIFIILAVIFLYFPVTLALSAVGLYKLFAFPEGLFSLFFPTYIKVKKYEDDAQSYKDSLREQRIKRIRERQEEEERKKRENKAFWNSLTGQQFERELAKLFRHQGYSVFLTPTTGDKGIDIILHREDRKTIVQCKAHKTKVGVATVRDLYGAFVHSKADDAILVSTNGFTSGVKDFIKDKPIKLIEIDDLIKMQPEYSSEEK